MWLAGSACFSGTQILLPAFGVSLVPAPSVASWGCRPSAYWTPDTIHFAWIHFESH